MLNVLVKYRSGNGAGPEAEATDGLPVLWHLKVSPYNEKARWALDYKGVPHVRRAITPPAHRKIARRLCGTETFPVLEFDGSAIGDSTDILWELERRVPKPPLFPGDTYECERALEIEDYFDEFAPHLRVLCLNHALPDPDLFADTFVPDIDPVRRAAARAAYPLMKRRIRRMFGIDEARIELAWQKLHKALERFAFELQPNGHLVGEGFTVADLAVAAIFSPAVAPAEFPYPQPQRDHELFAPLRAAFEDTGAGEWTREIYARHRGRSSEVGPHGTQAETHPPRTLSVGEGI